MKNTNNLALIGCQLHLLIGSLHDIKEDIGDIIDDNNKESEKISEDILIYMNLARSRLDTMTAQKVTVDDLRLQILKKDIEIEEYRKEIKSLKKQIKNKRKK